MYPTPELGNSEERRSGLIYDPAEDTFLLLDALEQDLPKLKSIDPTAILEVGSGSGCVITFLSMMLIDQLKRPVTSVGIDINPYAALASKRCMQLKSNNVTHGDTILGSLLDFIRPQTLDIVVFNPPYVVSDDLQFDEAKPGDIDSAWAGGANGRYWIDQFFQSLFAESDRLSANSNNFNIFDAARCRICKGGLVYLVALEYNNPQEIMDMAIKKFGFQSAGIIARRSFGIEKLCIIRFIY